MTHCFRKDVPVEGSLCKIDREPIPSDLSEIRLFMVIRNEFRRLHYFLKYYRTRGVDRFFVIDNDSTDQTREYLIQQKDVHLFYTKDSYGKANCGHDWLLNLASRFGKGYWCMFVDADELFVYPHDDRINIKDLCNYMDGHGHTSIISVFLDMYANAPLSSDLGYEIDMDPLKKCPYFEMDSIYLEKDSLKSQILRLFLNQKPKYRYRGGVRNRVFGTKCDLSKISIFKNTRDVQIMQGCHRIRNSKPTDIIGVVLHFKFLCNFVSYALQESKRGEHWDGASEYVEYANRLNEFKEINLFCSSSIRYQDTDQLQTLGLIKCSETYERYVHGIVAA